MSFIAVINRICVWYYFGPGVAKQDEPLPPTSFCGIVSFFFAICLIFCKKDSSAFHFFAYVGLFAGLIPTFYNTYISQGSSDVFNCPSLFFPPTITSMLHHSIMLMMAIMLFVLGWVKPSVKKWHCFPIGWGLLTLYGVILNAIYKIPNNRGFNIGVPVAGPLTSPILFLIGIVLFSIFIFVFDAIENKKDSFFPTLFRKVFKK